MNDEKSKSYVMIHVNPLVMTELDFAMLGQEPTYESIVRFLHRPDCESDIEHICARYREVAEEPLKLSFAPVIPEFLDKIVWPLRHAKGSFMIGNYLGTISLCGTVAEMLAILVFEMSSPRINNRIMNDQDQKGLFGNTFEKLGQDRRLAALKTYELINDEVKKDLDRIRENRRRYLHFFSQANENISRDAIETYYCTVKSVVTLLIKEIKAGEIIWQPNFRAYLSRNGAIKTDPNWPESAL